MHMHHLSEQQRYAETIFTAIKPFYFTAQASLTGSTIHGRIQITSLTQTTH